MPVPHQPIRAFQWDLARQVERLDWLLAQLPRYAEWGYQELYLHLEDAVEYPRLPGVARADAYTYRQLEKLVAAATRVGIGVVPIVNLLGHTQYLIKVPELRDLNELRGPDGAPLASGQICPLHPRTLEVAEKLLRDMTPFCTTGKVHVGLDESFHLGQHPLSRAEVAQIGLPAHFANYVKRLQALNQSLGLRTGMWADMLYFLPKAIPLLPRGLIAYDWYYYPFKRHPRVEFFNFAEHDLAKPLQKQGIDYWGCPMNGAFRFEPMPIFGDRLANIRSWWERCQRVKAQGFLVTSWEPNRLAMETTTTVDAAAASLWLDAKPRHAASHLARGVTRAFPNQTSQSATALARAALRADAHTFAGYARWEINRRWDLASGAASAADYRRELRYFSRLLSLSRRQRWPEPFVASWALRRYLAQRDVFVADNQATVFRLRRLIHRKLTTRALAGIADLQRQARVFRTAWQSGHLAAQAMWRTTRDRRAKSPNAIIFQNDLRQLIRWEKWLAKCQRNPAMLWTANPVCGRWQLFYQVWNYAPAVQRVSVEQWQDGAWAYMKTCHTIEFQACAAVQTSRITRQHSSPINWTGVAETAPQLRLTVRGVGSIKIGAICLTDGVNRIQIGATNMHWRKLGSAAPRHGLPKLDQVAELPLPLVGITEKKKATGVTRSPLKNKLYSSLSR